MRSRGVPHILSVLSSLPSFKILPSSRMGTPWAMNPPPVQPCLSQASGYHSCAFCVPVPVCSGQETKGAEQCVAFQVPLPRCWGDSALLSMRMRFHLTLHGGAGPVTQVQVHPTLLSFSWFSSTVAISEYSLSAGS